MKSIKIGKLRLGRFLAAVCGLGLVSVYPLAFSQDFTVASYETQARILFERITGTKLPYGDPRFTTMVNHLTNGEYKQAAAVALEDQAYYNVTIRNMAEIAFTDPNTKDPTLVDPSQSFNDFTAMWMGLVQDERDFREIMHDNFGYRIDPSTVNGSSYYKFTNDHSKEQSWIPQPMFYRPEQYGNQVVTRTYADFPDFSQMLTRFNDQYVGAQMEFDNNNAEVDPRGIAGTLSAFQQVAIYLGGTRRRTTKSVYAQYLCKDITELADNSLPGDWIRQDVDRFPVGDNALYQNFCLSCHSILDSEGGAYLGWGVLNNGNGRGAYIPNNNDQLGSGFYHYNKNKKGIGHETNNNAWEILHAESSELGFDPNVALHPRNVGTINDSFNSYHDNSLARWGQTLANTEAFAQCMAERAFERVCRRPIDESLEDDLDVRNEAVAAFINSSYNMKELYKELAVQPSCTGVQPL